jgi:phosphate transport system protein
MAEVVEAMLRDGLDAFVLPDAQRAERVATRADGVDDLYAQVFRDLLTYMLEDPRAIQCATHLLMAGQALGRGYPRGSGNSAERHPVHQYHR